MTNPIIRIHNAETDEIIDREMTASELKDYLAEQERAQGEIAAVAEKAQTRAALLSRLGITEDEAKLLLG
jgi:hypothetical protein